MMIKLKAIIMIMMIANIMTAMLLASEMEVRILTIYAAHTLDYHHHDECDDHAE